MIKSAFANDSLNRFVLSNGLKRFKDFKFQLKTTFSADRKILVVPYPPYSLDLGPVFPFSDT